MVGLRRPVGRQRQRRLTPGAEAPSKADFQSRKSLSGDSVNVG
jgi:hypothetical protein